MRDLTINDLIVAATVIHDGQKRKGTGLPYAVHPIEVMKTVAGWGVKDENIWKACLFHDVLEDCPKVNRDRVLEVIGDLAYNVVEQLTITTEDKQQYLASFKDKGLAALIIKLADRICNVRDYINDKPEYAKKYYKKADLLFAAFYFRVEEVREAFGQQVVMNINKSVKQLERDLEW